MTAGAVRCVPCGSALRASDRFCPQCGAPPGAPARAAELKQVTVLFADVVRSMDVAAAVGPERLRDIMARLLEVCATVVRRYGGTLDKFTGDGIMAVFGAPKALEDHALRACLAALAIQSDIGLLREEVQRCDQVDLQLRIGLNSGQVVAGDLGASTYTAIGDQVGMAQRMESVAPPGGVMLSEATARLVQNGVVLGPPESVRVKGLDSAVPARVLLGVGPLVPRGSETPLVGRRWELNAVAGVFEEALSGAGAVLTVAGPAGIGKSRIVRELAGMAAEREVPVFATYCESHASDIPYRAISRLLRVSMGVDDLEEDAARAAVRELFAAADAEDLVLLQDLLGIRDAATPLPNIAPDARRRRLISLINAASLASAEPAVYVIEDAHWIDDASEGLLCGFLSVVQQTPMLVVITYRPEYRGPLSQIPWAQMMALRALSEQNIAALVTAALGADPGLTALRDRIAARASGNPFFAHEIVRDLAERGVLQGTPGSYCLNGRDVADVDVPATVQAAIAARIDRLPPTAKRTLQAGAVLGTRFPDDLLRAVLPDGDVVTLIESDLVEQVRFSPVAEFAFRHPLIHAVAYESQLKADRAQLHRRLADAIEAADPTAADQNSALIAEHIEASGDLQAAFAWHMRAGSWWTYRDIYAAQSSWRRAVEVADRLSQDHPDRLRMRIQPRSLIAGTAWRVPVRQQPMDVEFAELRHLCELAGDRQSSALGMGGYVSFLLMQGRRAEAARMADELAVLIKSVAEPAFTVGVSLAIMSTKIEIGSTAEVFALADTVVGLTAGDSAMGNLVFESPLALALTHRGVSGFSLARPGWGDDFRRAIDLARANDPMTLATVLWYGYALSITQGVLLPGGEETRNTLEALTRAEQSGDDYVVATAEASRGLVLMYQAEGQFDVARTLLDDAFERVKKVQFNLLAIPPIQAQISRDVARAGAVDEAIDIARGAYQKLLETSGWIWIAPATAALVEALLQRGADEDFAEARQRIAELAAIPADPEFVLHKIWLARLRALLARAESRPDYARLRDAYRECAHHLRFQGHTAMAEALP